MGYDRLTVVDGGGNHNLILLVVVLQRQYEESRAKINSDFQTGVLCAYMVLPSKYLLLGTKERPLSKKLINVRCILIT